MKVLGCLLVTAVMALAALGCVCGFSSLSRDGESETAEVLSVTVLSDDSVVEDTPDENETAEAKQWVRVTFDVVVITLSVGVIALAIWAAKRVMKRYGGGNRRF